MVCPFVQIFLIAGKESSIYSIKTNSVFFRVVVLHFDFQLVLNWIDYFYEIIGLLILDSDVGVNDHVEDDGKVVGLLV